MNVKLTELARETKKTVDAAKNGEIVTVYRDTPGRHGKQERQGEAVAVILSATVWRVAVQALRNIAAGGYDVDPQAEALAALALLGGDGNE
jgi:hypothetical protein